MKSLKERRRLKKEKIHKSAEKINKIYNTDFLSTLAKRSYDEFLAKHKGEVMYLAIRDTLPIKVKVIGGSTHTDYENILVKLLEEPKWIKDVFLEISTFTDQNRKQRTWFSLKKFTKMYVAKYLLYSLEDITKKTDSKYEFISQMYKYHQKEYHFFKNTFEFLENRRKNDSKAKSTK